MVANPDYRYSGLRGEALAESFLLQFLTLGRPAPDEGIDHVGWFKPGLCRPGNEHISFFFQTKTGVEFRLSSKRFHDLAVLVDSAPVILLFIPEDRTIRYCVFFEWLLHAPSTVLTVPDHMKVTVPAREFLSPGVRGARFSEMLEREANRVMRRTTSRWRTRQSKYLPLSLVDLLSQMGRVHHAESPQSILEVARAEPNVLLAEDQWQFLRDVLRDNPQKPKHLDESPGVADWLRKLAVEPTPMIVRQQQLQFARFVTAMTTSDATWTFPMPRFRYQEVSCWRVFVSLFPGSLQLIERVLSTPDRWTSSQLMAVFLLASSLAATDMYRANDILRKAAPLFRATRAKDYREYRVLQQFQFTLAEANGDRSSVSSCVEFLRRHPPAWNRRHNRSYYADQTDESLHLALKRKLTYPRPRDLNTERISIEELELLYLP